MNHSYYRYRKPSSSIHQEAETKFNELACILPLVVIVWALFKALAGG